jgi:putative aminopeptidase FrvX
MKARAVHFLFSTFYFPLESTMPAYTIDPDSMLSFLETLLNTPSPTGYHERAIEFCQQAFADLPLTLSKTNKGALIGTWPGQHSDQPRALTAHIDTLGAMVSVVKSDGRLKLTQLGGWAWGSVEGEGVTIITHSGKEVRGTIMPVKASVHVFGAEARDFKRDEDAYAVRIDERTSSAAETRKLGIEVGDFVVFDPRVEISKSGFIRSRHLDDKASVACIYGALKALAAAGLTPHQRTTIHISNYEEVGHGGASGFPADLKELLTIDMAASGAGDQNSDEFSVGICVKDSGGPYHIEMKRRMMALAEKANIPCKLDVYPFYGSDGEAFWRAGGDVLVGLIGPGVEASHHYERTHIDSLVATAQLIAEYLITP